MTISVWRYSHLALAVSSFILLTLAAVTGVILAFQPVIEKLQPYETARFSNITLAQTLPALRKAYPGISEITVDANHFVLVKGSDADGKKLLAYVDPLSGKILGTPKPESEFFQWVTALHRSLFFHETGRFFIGLTAFLLSLITVSGTMLLIQRQRGVKRFFSKIPRDGFAQFYHVVLGRWSLIPIFIIALSGTYLSLARFGLVDTTKAATKVNFDAIKTVAAKDAVQFSIFNKTALSEVESVEFPFSEDAEDYYTLKLKTAEIAVNQINGDILSEVHYPSAVILTNLSLALHTGRASSVWAIILAVASANILFFIYSGFAITFKRLAGRTKNKYKARESEFIILVGSENGNTFRFAQASHASLLEQGKKSFITNLNNYEVFPKAKHIIIMTATYGLGDAPSNSDRFAGLLKKFPQSGVVNYSVLGFGSHAYPDFCKFAYEVNQLMAQQSWAKPLVDIHTVNERSPEEFKLWAEAWSQQSGLQLSVSETTNPSALQLEAFTVGTNTGVSGNTDTFTVTLKGGTKQRAVSGDLLAIYPANDHRERLYSVGIVNDEIRLSVRLHEGGLGSGFLHRLKPDDQIKGKIVDNRHFHFPAKATEVVMIANGTGIAPFLGMISQNTAKVPTQLYCGFRHIAVYEIYRDLLEEGRGNGKLGSLHVALSREGAKQYVSHLIERDGSNIAGVLKNGGVLMLCGSLSMQKDVMNLLDTICHVHTGKSVSFYQSHDQILTDCY